MITSWLRHGCTWLRHADAIAGTCSSYYGANCIRCLTCLLNVKLIGRCPYSYYMYIMYMKLLLCVPLGVQRVLPINNRLWAQEVSEASLVRMWMAYGQ